MKKLILILALGLVLAACAGETRAVVVTATPAPTATTVPPTATPVQPDATVNAISTGLRELPHLTSQVLDALPGGT